MKFRRKYVFYFTAVIWLLSLISMIYGIVYAPIGSFAKQYVFIFGLFFITFTQFVKRAYRYSFKTERRFRN